MQKKSGFSMLEMLVILCFIGIIVIIELVILNNKLNEYSSPYFTAYNALKKASYNVLADMYCPGESCPAGVDSPPREFPKNSQQLCERLAEFINTAELNCADTSLDINDDAKNIDIEHPRMIASNSFRFHFSDLKEIELPNNYGGMDKLEYFVTYVDINGTKKPNRLTCTRSKLLPDIVPFAITRRGEVIPMGFPVYSKTYLTAKIKYPSRIAADGSTEKHTSGSMSYYDAIYGAWPQTGTKEVQQHINIPLSVMYAQDSIYKDSDIKQCYDASNTSFNTELRTDTEYKNLAQNKESEGCKGGTYNCRVVVDSIIETRW